MNTINVTAMLQAGFTITELLDASAEDRQALFELFPGPTVEITVEGEPEWSADLYEAELAKAPAHLQEVLRQQCDGDPTTVYAVLNNCIVTKNQVLRDIVRELHEDDWDWSE